MERIEFFYDPCCPFCWITSRFLLEVSAERDVDVTWRPFSLAMKITLIAALVVSAPVWLYQIWSFVVPGLLAKEKKWALIFVTASSPLFAAGVALVPEDRARQGIIPAHSVATNLSLAILSRITRGGMAEPSAWCIQ